MVRPVHVHHADAVVVGSGIAGLSTALGLDSCTVLTRGTLSSGSSELAQGGIAAAIGPTDDAAAHGRDTLAVSGGIADEGTVAAVTAAAAGRIDWLVDLGTDFDRGASGAMRLGREAGHSANRIVHADGDGTGAAVMRTLRAAVEARQGIAIATSTDAVDLIRDGEHVAGVLALDASGELIAYLARAVVLATGGIGGVYERTTNPTEVAGDGLAMAARAAAELADLEFVQFHPTALTGGADPAPLVTEALRGAGARIVDGDGRAFMAAIHPDAELAPRDIVARAIWEQLSDGKQVFLDATTCVGHAFPERFPTVWAHAVAAGLDPRVEPLPIAPAEHYHMGGIATDRSGATSLPGLWAVGEVAATGLHGANRLASNSLLEGLVAAAATARSIRCSTAHRSPRETSLAVPAGALTATRRTDPDVIAAVRAEMWQNVGLVRDAAGLRSARNVFRRIMATPASGISARNLPLVADLISRAALAREESRGAHYRRDHPAPKASWRHRTFVTPPVGPYVDLPLPISSAA